MADVNPADIDAYGKYLLQQGNKPEDVSAYTQYLGQHHGVPAAAEGNDFLDSHPTLKTAVSGAIEDLPLAGSLVGGAIGGGAGSVIAPVAGTAIGASAGAGLGAATGSVVKDTLNSWIFGKSKSVGDVAKDAAIEGGINAGASAIGDTILGAGKLATGTQLGEKVIGAAGDLASKTGEAIFRVPADVIKRYAQAAGEIGKMSTEADGDIAAASDTVRQSFTQSIDGFRQQVGSQIGAALESSDKTIEAKPIIEALKDQAQKINPKLYPEQITQINGMISKVKALAGIAEEKAPDGAAGELAQFISKMKGSAGQVAEDSVKGQIPVAEAHQLKQYLQDVATSAYRNPGEATVGTLAAQTAKRSAAVTRKLINEAVPEVASANNKLAILHTIEDNMNKSLIRQGASESGLVAAGKGANPRNARALEKLGDLVGTDFLGQAQNLGAMKVMGDASLKKAGAGALVGGGLGYMADGKEGALVGAGVGGAITSPLALKKAIDLGRSVGQQAGTPLGKQALGRAVMSGSGAINKLKAQESGQ